MRTRKEIERVLCKIIADKDSVWQNICMQSLMMDILLDIRELLEKKA